MSIKRNFTNHIFDDIKNEDLSAVQNLLENGNVDLRDRDEDGQTCLMQACEKGSTAIVRELLDVDVDVNAVDNDGCTALMISSKEGHVSIVIELLDRGAVLEIRDMCSWTALMWACYRGRSLVVQELLERGAQPNIKADFSVSCLTWAAGRGFSDIGQMLISKGAKVNTSDKYGTTPLIWAARKGYTRLVDMLLSEGANVDSVGMDSLTPLITAAKGGYSDIVTSILDHQPAVNAVDKDGFTALMIAAKDNHINIVNSLLGLGAYVNICDKEGDSVLTHAVKGGHIDVVRALLARYADVDLQSAGGKTALYWAVEKNHNEIVNILLQNDADTEKLTTGSDTALMRAVRSRNVDCVFMLIKSGAKVSVADKKGDTALHIALRARSKRITELLLRNPKNSRLLYKPNRVSETPYSIDTHYQKGILSQIFGHRNLNASDGENLLGYEIYSSTLADILSEPALNTPIIVGLYAKWGSGKSFLLSKLQVEMKNFMHSAIHATFAPNVFLFLVSFCLNFVVAYVLGLALMDWRIPLGVGLGLFLPQYIFLITIWVGGVKYESKRCKRISERVTHYSTRLQLLLKLLFCNPRKDNKCLVPLVKFLFSDYSRITSVGGEKCLAAMIGTLCDSVEAEYGSLVTRLAGVFNPSHRGSRRFKSICCVPYFIIFLFTLSAVFTGIGLLITYKIQNTAVNGILIAIACIVAVLVIGNVYTWGQAVLALAVPQKSRVIAAANNIDTLKLEGLMQKLKQEVDVMANFVSAMDCFTGDQTRLVLIMDGLDSCEQDKIFYMLDTIKVLFSDDCSPFITILAVDPHVIIRGLERNLKGDNNINGYDYLRNIVHLPFYLQSQGVKIQKDGNNHRPSRGHAGGDIKIARQESTMSSLSLNESNKHLNLKKSGQSLHGSSFDLTKTLIKNDYFSDINPRSMRRLMNIVAVTGRLLRAYNIDFTWNRLAAWINVIEQWPYRMSWIIQHWEDGAQFSHSHTLLSLFQQIEEKIPSSRDIDPLMEIDRNVRKFVAFLSTHSSSYQMLNVGDLQKFLPITVNLDPYLRKLIRELQQNVEVSRTMDRNLSYPNNLHYLDPQIYAPIAPLPSPRHTRSAPTTTQQTRFPFTQFGLMQQPGLTPQTTLLQQQAAATLPYLQAMQAQPYAAQTRFRVNFKGTTAILPLSSMTLGQVCETLSRLDGVSTNRINEYHTQILENNITGMVLYNCDVDELKSVMAMNFGDWQLFRAMVLYLRHCENTREACVGMNTFDNGCKNVKKGGDNMSTTGSKSETEINKHVVIVDDKNIPHSDIDSVSPMKSSRKWVSDNPRQLFKRKDSVMEQMKIENEILFEVLDEFVSDNDLNDTSTKFYLEDESPERNKSPVAEPSVKGSVSNPSSESSNGNVLTDKTQSSHSRVGIDQHDRTDNTADDISTSLIPNEKTFAVNKPSKSGVFKTGKYPSVRTVISASNQKSGQSTMFFVKPDYPVSKEIHKPFPNICSGSMDSSIYPVLNQHAITETSPDADSFYPFNKQSSDSKNLFPDVKIISNSNENTSELKYPDQNLDHFWSGDDVPADAMPLLQIVEPISAQESESDREKIQENIIMDILSSAKNVPRNGNAQL